MRTLWDWLCSQAVPGMVLAAWIGSIPIGTWVHKVTERRHRERVAATERLTAQLARNRNES